VAATTALVVPRLAAGPASGLEGSWKAEQTNSDGTAPIEATLSFTFMRGALSGVMRASGEELPLFDVKEAGSNVSFALVIPGTPYIAVHYAGVRDGDDIRVVSTDEGHGVFALTAHRLGAPAPAAPAPVAAVAPPPPAAAPAAAATPSRRESVLLPAPPAAAMAALNPPALRRSEPAPSTGRLEGSWTAQQSSPGSAAPVDATLLFTGNHGVMQIGADSWPLFEVKESGPDIAFTLVIPGTPYVSIHYSGTLMGDELQLASVDPDQGAFRIQARRAGTQAPPPIVASLPAPQRAPDSALLNPPAPASPPADPVPPPARPEELPAAPVQIAPPAAAIPPMAAAPGPPQKPDLPPLRDLPPNNLAKTPLMGWASREKLGAMIEDDVIRQAAEGLDETNLRGAGFVYVEIDDGWQGGRDANGVLRGNEKFPDMKALGDYIHSKRLKFGLQTSAGLKSCGGFEGSYGHEAEDAKTFASWGVDYLVYDWCGAESLYTSEAEQQAATQKMAEALRASRRDIAFGIRQTGASDVARWGAKAGANLWRSGRDVEDNWSSAMDAGFALNATETFAGPGHWNDPGLLQVGNGGMTPDEYRSQLNLWAVLAAPMMLGNDVRIMTRETLATLINEEIIAVDQDPLGRQGKRVVQNGKTEVWARPLADGSTAVAFFNRGDQSAPIAVSWAQLGLEGPRNVRDLWWHQNIGAANGRFVVFLTGHASLLVKMSR
jgi:alpha-galactosidase